MTVQVWRIAAVTPQYTADDLSGEGAKRTGGRWNSPGMPMVYAAENISLAVHETLVHLRADGLPLNRYLVRIDIPEVLWQNRTVLTPPVGWDAEPCGLPSMQAGDAWLQSKSSVLLQVPSVIVPEEHNILINPMHPDSAHIKATMLRKWLYDPRYT